MSNSYVGVNGLARKVTDLYVGVNGVARRVSKGYVGVNGVARQFYSAAQPVQPLSALNVGDTLESPVASAWQSRFGQKIVWKVADKNHEGYPESSVLQRALH